MCGPYGLLVAIKNTEDNMTKNNKLKAKTVIANKSIILDQKAKTDIANEQGWYNNKDIKVPYSAAYEIGELKGGKLYGYLPEEFQQSSWKNSLSKGFAKKSVGANGVKFLEHKLLELKINGDERLYTFEVHKNDKGDYLAIFDKETGHKLINKLGQSSKEMIFFDDCSSNLQIEKPSVIHTKKHSEWLDKWYSERVFGSDPQDLGTIVAESSSSEISLTGSDNMLSVEEHIS